MRRNTRKRGGSTKLPAYKVTIYFFFKKRGIDPEDRPNYINNVTWQQTIDDWQNTDDLYVNEPSLIEQKVKSYPAMEIIEPLLDVDDTLFDAKWLNGEFGIEFRIRSPKSRSEVESHYLNISIDNYLWYKSEDPWNVWSLGTLTPYAFLDYRNPDTIQVKKIWIPQPSRGNPNTRKSRKVSLLK